MGGSRRQISYEMKRSLIEKFKSNPNQTTKGLQSFFLHEYNWEICQTTVSCILRKEGLRIKKIGGKGRNGRLYKNENSASSSSSSSGATQEENTSSGGSSIISSGSSRSNKTGLSIKDILCDEDEDESTKADSSNSLSHSGNSASTDKTSDATNSSNNKNGTKNNMIKDIYNIGIINPTIKRFRPSTQFQELEKLVLKLTFDLYNEKVKKFETQKEFYQRTNNNNINNMNNNTPLTSLPPSPHNPHNPGSSSYFNQTHDNKITLPPPQAYLQQQQQQLQQQQQPFPPQNQLPPPPINMSQQYATPTFQENSCNNTNYPSPGSNAPNYTYMPNNYTISKTDMVKLIKQELSKEQYKDIQKPIYLNQFIHKCLNRYRLTNELMEKLEKS